MQIVIDPFPHESDLDTLWRSAWRNSTPKNYHAVLSRSLAHAGAYDAARLVGFVNVAWDGGIHAFILDTCVHSDHRRKGVGTLLVSQAIAIASARGANWLHVDFEPHLAEFYTKCGFRGTAAGLLRL